MKNKLHSVPSLNAIVIQLIALLILFILSFSISFISIKYFNFYFSLPIFVLFLIQSLLALFLSYAVSTPRWWYLIHFSFPLIVYFMLNLNIPHDFYLIGFLVFLAFFWTTFRTQVPFYPSKPNIWHNVLSLIPQKNDVVIRFVDVGSGLGDMAMYIAQMRSDVCVEGVEVAPLPWLLSVLRAKFSRSSAKFNLVNYQKLNFQNYDVIFAYLSPAVMSNLWNKCQQEMKVGSLLISYEFEISEVEPSYIVSTGEKKPKIYIWQM